MIASFLIVACGGFLGSILRFFISEMTNKHIIGTWFANISGSFLLGILLKYYLQGIASEAVWLFLGVGFCGAYTTFSTFGSETIQLIEKKKFGEAALYMISSFAIAIGSVVLVLIY